MEKDKPSSFNSVSKSKFSRHLQVIEKSKQLYESEKQNTKLEPSSTQIRIKKIQPEASEIRESKQKSKSIFSQQLQKKQTLIDAGRMTLSNNQYHNKDSNNQSDKSDKFNKTMNRITQSPKQSLLPSIKQRNNQQNQQSFQQFKSQNQQQYQQLSLPYLEKIKKQKQRRKKLYKESYQLEYLSSARQASVKKFVYSNEIQKEENKRSTYLNLSKSKEKQKTQEPIKNRTSNVSLSSLKNTQRYRIQEDKLLSMKLAPDNLPVNTKTVYEKKAQKEKIERKRIDVLHKKQIRQNQDKQILPIIRKIVPVDLYNKQNQSTPYIIEIAPKILQNRIQYRASFQKKQSNNQTQGCTFQDILSENVPKSIDNLDRISNLNTQKNDLAVLLLKQIISKPLDSKAKEQDAALKLKNRQKIQKQKSCFSSSIVLELLKNSLQKMGRQVRFTQKADFTTELSLKSLATGYLLDRTMCTVKFQDEQTPWAYDQIASNNEKLINFQKHLRKHVTQKLGIDGDSITIHSIKKGSIQATFSTNQTDKLQRAVYKLAANENNSFNDQNNQNRSNGVSNPANAATFTAGRYTLHPYFSSFNLSPQMFDARGDITFSNQKHDIQFRGGWPYYQPVSCKRFGLNVLGKFDCGNNNWLSMNGIKGQWVCAFHGVRRPDNHTNDKTPIHVLNSIMGKKGEQKQTAYIRKGYNNAYSASKSVNSKENQLVGEGIYCSPHIQETFSYSAFIKKDGVQKQYSLIFQCRVNPQKIKVCPKQQFWVINQSKDIRPYGIILRELGVKYPSIQQQFKQKFKYSKFKDQILKWQSSHQQQK